MGRAKLEQFQTMTKQEIRKQVKERIARLSAAQRDTASLYVCLQVIGSAEWQQAQTVLLYEAMPDEIDLSLLIQDARDSDKQILMPEAAATAPDLDPASLQKVDIAIVPGRAFTKQGDRMGRGKGYYDRLLPQLHCPKWGVAFDCQLYNTLPTDPWDQPLDRVISS